MEVILSNEYHLLPKQQFLHCLTCLVPRTEKASFQPLAHALVEVIINIIEELGGEFTWHY